MTFYRSRMRYGLGDDQSSTLSASSQLLQMKQWNPTGYYTPAQVLQIYDAVRAVEGSISTAIDKYIANGQVAVSPIDIVQGVTASAALVLIPKDLRTIQNQVMATLNTFIPYIRAAGVAQQSGAKIVDAPGLQRTVSDAMTTYAQAMEAFRRLQAGAADIGGVWNYVGQLQVTLQKVAGVAWDVAKAAGNFVVKVPDTVGTILTVAKWGALALGALFVYEEARRIRGGA